MAHPDTSSGPLDTFLMPHLLALRKSLTTEHNDLHHRWADVCGEMRKLSSEIRPARDAGRNGLVRKNIERLRVLQKENDGLRWQIWALQRRLKTKEMRTLDFAINKAIDAQAQASCLALTGRMHTTLPRELRDLVYDELVDMDSFAARLRARLEAQDAPLPSGPASHPRPHWMSHLFVTGPVLDEMIHRALWQLKRRPYDATQTVTCRFDAFLEREVEDGTGFLPRDIFPNLRIEISPRKLNQLWRDEQGVGPSHQDPRFADAAGEMLERIPRRPGETLHILISEQMVRKWEMAWMRPAIEKMLGRVREALGGKVTVEWANVKTKALLDGAVVVFPLTAKELERDDVCFCPFD